MSGMAGEIMTRMREDGVNPAERFEAGASDGPVPMTDVPPVETPGSPSGTAVPGSEGGDYRQPAATTPPAGAQNTETVATDGEPGPVPYARFKEVNDQLSGLRGYSELSNLGYDPDSLGRLAAFESQYLRDPMGTISVMVDDLDLPPESVASIKEALGARGQSEAPVEQDGDTSSLSNEDRELLDWARGAREREVDSARNAQLDHVVNTWKAMDNKDEVRTPPDHRVLTFVSAAAARGGFTTLEQLAEMARNDYLDEREQILGGAVQRGRQMGQPPSALPGSAVPAPPQKFRNLTEASKAARAAMERGELPEFRT